MAYSRLFFILIRSANFQYLLVNPFAEVSEFIIKIIVYTLVAVVLIIILVNVINWYIENQSVIHRSVAQVCGLEEKLRSTLNEEILSKLPENTDDQRKTKQILKKVIEGKDVTDEEYQKVMDVLDIVEKRRLGIEDLEKICNFV